VLPACLCALLGMTAAAQDEPADVYVYSTYHNCDFSGQDRADEIYEKVQKPVNDAAVKDGTIKAYGRLAHQTGGQWRRADFFTAGSVVALLDAQKKMIDMQDPKHEKLAAEAGHICSSHDDYIWRRVAGNAGATPSGGAAFSTYYVCDQTRESRVDELTKNALGPLLDKMVADGKLKTWGWLEHIVGGEYRRLATMSAADLHALMEARAALVEALDGNAAGDLLTEICPTHTDYIWEYKAQAP
jgi:hypothetical protein